MQPGRPDGEPRGRGVPAAHHDGHRAPARREPPREPGGRPGHGVRRRHARQEPGRQVEVRDDVGRPGVAGHVPQERARGVGPVGRGDGECSVVDEPRAHDVLGQQHVRRAVERRGVVRGEPVEHGPRHPRHERVRERRPQGVGQRAPAVEPVGRARVRPQDGRHDGVPRRVHEHRGVHLAGDADRAHRDLAEPGRAGGEVVEGGAERRRPGRRGRLGAAGARVLDVVRRLGLRDDRPVPAEEDELEPARPEVDAEGGAEGGGDQGHGTDSPTPG